MASTTSIVAQIKGDASNFDKATNNATARAKQFGKDLNQIDGSGFGANFGRGISTRFTELSSKISLIKAGLNTLAIPVQLAASEDDLTDRLEAVMGSASAAEERMKMWRDAASLPGVKFEVIAEADSRLQALGFTAEKSKEMLLQMANVVANGYDPAALGTLAAALGKIKDKGDVSVKALVGMSQQMPLLAKVIHDQFGTESAADIEALDLTTQEFIDNLIEGLSRLPTKAKDGFDVLENRAERYHQFLATLGKAAADLALTGGEAASEMTGVFDAIKDGAANMSFEPIKAAVTKLSPMIHSALTALLPGDMVASMVNGTIPGLQPGATQTREQQGETEEQRQARIEAFDKRRRDNANAAAEEEKQKKLEATAPDRERERAEHRIQQLRNVGLEKQAAAEERALKTAREKQRLEALGFTAAEAAAMAQSKTDAEDPGKKRGHIKRLTPEENALLGQQRMSTADRAKAARGEHAIGTLGVTQSFGRSTEMKPSGMDYFEEARQNRIRNQPPKRPAANAPGSKLESQVLAAGGTSADAKAMLNKLDQLILTVKTSGRDPSAPTIR